eukprot:3235966-Rhodomonas_salina.1
MRHGSARQHVVCGCKERSAWIGRAGLTLAPVRGSAAQLSGARRTRRPARIKGPEQTLPEASTSMLWPWRESALCAPAPSLPACLLPPLPPCSSLLPSAPTNPRRKFAA